MENAIYDDKHLSVNIEQNRYPSIKKAQILWILLIFVLPFGGFAVNTPVMAISLPNILVLITGLYVILIHRRSGVFSLSRDKVMLVTIILYLFFEFLGLQRGESLRSYRHGMQLIGYILILISTIIVLNISRDKTNFFKKGLLTLIFSVLLFCLLFLRSAIPVMGTLHQRLALPQYTFLFRMDYGHLGMFLISSLNALILLLFIPEYSRALQLSSFRLKVFLGLSMCLIIITIWLTGSRSTWVATGISLFILLNLVLRYRIRLNRSLLLTLSMFAICLMILVAPLAYKIMYNVVNSLIGIRPFSVSTRIIQYQTSLRLTSVNIKTFLFGLGYDKFVDFFANEYYYSMPKELRIYSTLTLHNFFLYKLLSIGFLGLISLVGIILLSLGRLLRIILESRINKDLLFFYFSSSFLFSSIMGMLVELFFFPGISRLKIFWLFLALANWLYMAYREHIKIPVP